MFKKLTIALLSLCLNASAITLAWSPSSSHNVFGYKLYYGPASNTYSNVVYTGLSTSNTVNGLVMGKTYYFVVSSYDLFFESDYTKEIVYTVPVTPQQWNFSMQMSNKIPVLKFNTQSNWKYDVQATTNLVNWTPIYQITSTNNGSISFVDNDARNYSERFYRVMRHY
jgi:hypothetical protein